MTQALRVRIRGEAKLTNELVGLVLAAHDLLVVHDEADLEVCTDTVSNPAQTPICLLLPEHAAVPGRPVIDGVDGWVDLGRPVTEIISVLRQVAAGTFRAEHRDENALSAREREVLVCVASGLDRPEIAESLGISVHTVRTHLNRIYAKLGVRNHVSAVQVASSAGLLSEAKPLR